MSAMLVEISCDKFTVNNVPRPPIRFHMGLNAVLGDDSGSNSIGKSTLLMIIDFVFGGTDYINKLKDVQEEVGEHTIKFAFLWDDSLHYFSRSTNDPYNIAICDKNYVVEKRIKLKKYHELLLDGYGIDLPFITFREIVSRYFRIHRRGNVHESHPLLAATRERVLDAINSFLKLFNQYSQIEDNETKRKVSKEKEETLKKAQDFSYLPKITKSQYKANEKKIKELNDKLNELSERSTAKLLETEAEEALEQSRLKSEYIKLNRRRTRLQSQLTSMDIDIPGNTPLDNYDLKELGVFFEGINLKPIETVNKFHENLRSVLNNEFEEEMQNTKAKISLLDSEIERIQLEINSNDELARVSKNVLDEYAAIKQQISELTAQNNHFDETVSVKKETQAYATTLADVKGEQTRKLQDKMNAELSRINNIIQNGSVAPPVLTFTKGGDEYLYVIPKDGGTGTSFLGLIEFDLSVLNLTALPAIIHDSFIFKQIAIGSIERVIKLYSEKTDKQIFIEFDRVNSYTPQTQELLLNSNTKVIQLNSDEPLFGRKWNKGKR
jgi:hypothetical protein